MRAIEDTRRFSNFGPQSLELERRLVEELFHGGGSCLAVANATLGLMLAIREAVDRAGRPGARYAIMPSFTFAATAQAAFWCGLEPLFCDVDEHTWLPDEGHVASLLAEYGETVAVTIPYATFGNSIDLRRHAGMAREAGCAIVVDAAASLGSKDAEGGQFGRSSPCAVVYSMHATKTFAGHEGGAVYAEDGELIERLRRMANFGFDDQRLVTLPGLNAKMSEVAALVAAEKLTELPATLAHRHRIMDVYRRELGGFVFQKLTAADVAHQFCAVRIPGADAAGRDAVVAAMALDGVEVRTYFSPPLHRQPYYLSSGPRTRVPVTERIATDIISLPVHDYMTPEDAVSIAGSVRRACREHIPALVDTGIV